MSQEAPRGEELSDVVIRQYRPEDRTELLSLLRESWPNYDPGIYRAKDYLIAENKGRIVGTVFCREVHTDMHLFDLIASESFRRQGIAAALIKAAEKRAAIQGLEHVRITADSDELVGYYERLGFKLSDAENRIMVKPIACLSPQI